MDQYLNKIIRLIKEKHFYLQAVCKYKKRKKTFHHLSSSQIANSEIQTPALDTNSTLVSMTKKK